MITTIITTYQRPHLLKRALKSVLNQTYQHFTVWVYDNASNDETEAMMLDFVKRDSRVHYFKHVENIGMMGNYAFAFSRIDTPYFSFLSDDDYLLPDFYETALNGFKKHPQAAFSACGVLAVDLNSQVVADPLSEWHREGYYPVPEGVFEMISKKSNFPIPTGVLFQHEIIKDIRPCWTAEIQVMWDPDYLVQIASQFPFVISKKIASIFFAHESAFSTGFYKRILKSATFLDEYIYATKMLIQRVKENPKISNDIKRKIKKTYMKMVREEVHIYMHHFIKEKNFSSSYYCGKVLFNECGINVKILKLLIKSVIEDKFPKIFRLMMKISNKINRIFRSRKTIVTHAPTHWRRFEYQDYSNSISK